MRTLTITSLFPNSAQPSHGIFVYRRVAAVAEIAGNETEVIAPIPYMPRAFKRSSWGLFARIPESESMGGVQVHHPKYPLLPKISMPLHGFLMYLGIRSLARRLHAKKPFDCIDAHYIYPDGMAAVLVAKSLDLPTVVSARGTDLNLFPDFPMIRPMIRWTLRNSSGVIAVSNALKDRAIELGVPEEKARLIGNGVDPELFYVMDRTEARKSLGIPTESKVLVCVASLRASKGQDLLLAALARAMSRHPELRLYLIGEGGSRNHIQAQIERWSLQERVFLMGNRGNEEITLWFNAADLSVLASASEGWPNVVLESLACGTPVIATRVGQIPEIISSNHLGILVDRDVDSLAGAIESGLARDWDRVALEKYAHNRPWSKVAEEVDRYLSGIVAEGSMRIANPVLAP